LIEEARVTASRTSRVRALSGLLAGAGMAVTLALTACSAGQLTQTSSQVPAVPGANVNAGTIALRNLLISYVGVGGYPAGADAPLEVRIFNQGVKPVRLVGASSAQARTVSLVGAAGSPSPSASPSPATSPSPAASASPSPAASGSPSPAAGSPSPSAAASPTPAPSPSAGPAGQETFSIEIPPQGYVLLVPGEGQYLRLTGLTKALTPGMLARVTFTFDDGNRADAEIPFAPAPTVPREGPVVPHENEE
jgi:copper(I)-binding protein